MRILRVGLRGPDVLELQSQLRSLGRYAGALDGVFGQMTLNAVMKLQRDSELTIDGVVGSITWRALEAMIDREKAQPEPPPVPGTTRPKPTLLTLREIDAAFEKGTAPWYQAAYLIQKPDPGTEGRIAAAAQRVLKNKAELYAPLEKARGIPWAMTAVIHSMECNNNPKGCLHNGQLIIGTNKKTTIVPKGRGPFKTWMEAALDAVDTEAIWRVPNWSIGYMLKQIERFNGTGYLKYHRSENSPYLWACTSINDGTGKYVADGKYDPKANANGQVGAAAILRHLETIGEFTPTFL